MKKKKHNKDNTLLIALAISVFVLIVIVIIVFVNLNRKLDYKFLSNNVSNEIIIEDEIQEILESERIKQSDEGIDVTFNYFSVDENGNSYFIINCTDKLDYMKEQKMIMNLANNIYEKLPEIYGKNSNYETYPRIDIISGANCMYREGWTISNGYLGTMIVK